MVLKMTKPRRKMKLKNDKLSSLKNIRVGDCRQQNKSSVTLQNN